MKITLHEAMVEVLRSRGSGWMSREAIALEIQRRDLYRKRSGTYADGDQLRLRALKYPHLFECRDPSCTSIRLTQSGSQSEAPRRFSRGAHEPGAVAKADNDPAATANWYDELREGYRPERLNVLLVGESAPDPSGGARRFFYSPTLTIDNLYRSVAVALYGETPSFTVRDKPAVLARLREDGYWLIDAVDRPINKSSNAERAQAIRDSLPRLIARCLDLAPERGVIICHGGVYAVAAGPLREAGVRILHSEPLPFPLGNWRAKFVQMFREALAGVDGRS